MAPDQLLSVTPQIATPRHHFGIDHFTPCSPVVIPIKLFERIEHACEVSDFSVDGRAVIVKVVVRPK